MKNMYIEWMLNGGETVTTFETGPAGTVDHIVDVLTNNLADAIYHVRNEGDDVEAGSIQVIHGRNVAALRIYVKDAPEYDRVWTLRKDQDGHLWVNVRDDLWSWGGFTENPDEAIERAIKDSKNPDPEDRWIVNVPEAQLESGP